MAIKKLTYKFLFIVTLLTMHTTDTLARMLYPVASDTIQFVHSDTVDAVRLEKTMQEQQVIDSTYQEIVAATASITPDSISVAIQGKQNTTEKITIRKPNPTTATWLALVIPGGGQIYNRKFWKLPIVYGGFVGCLYAYNWNGQMYKDYRQAYLDIMDNNPNTDSYKDFFRPGYDFEANKEYLADVFKKRKDRYRRWRDLSIFAFIGVYALSVIDAYVDAQLSNFDISEDIHLSIEPQIIDSRQMYGKDFYGLNCNISF